MKVYLITARSESGDEYGPWVYEWLPDDKQLEELLRKECPEEFIDGEEGPGMFGSYLHVVKSGQVQVR